MTWRVILLGALRTWLICASWMGFAQGTVSGQPAVSVEDSLHTMAAQAGVIFVGTVLRVTHKGGADGASAGVVEVDFEVGQAVRGCTSGAVYTLREWGGLWAPNQFRYQVGETKLMLLHAPGASGLSSPVGGTDGAIPVRGDAASQVENGSTAASEPIVDLRWVAANVARPLTYATAQTGRHLPQPISSSGPEQMDANEAASPRSMTTARSARSMAIRSRADIDNTAAIASTSVDAQQASVSTVLHLIASWQEQTNASR